MDHDGITITLREIYDQVVATREEVQTLTQTRDAHSEKLADFETRLRTLERWKYSIPVALIGSGLAAITSLTQGGVA